MFEWAQVSLGFAAKVTSTDKFWKQEFYMNAPVKFVRVLQAKDYDDDCFYYFKSSLVPLIEGLCG